MKNKNISNEKMKIILEEISSPDGKYFGGVTAYLCAEFALALLEKLNFRIARKNAENSSFFLNSGKKASSLKEYSDYLASNDGDIFKKMFELPQEEKNIFLKNVIIEQNKFLNEILLLQEDIKKACSIIKGSVKEDYFMVDEILTSSYKNINTIIKFEEKKIK